jgi:predicted N-acyltransferase
MEFKDFEIQVANSVEEIGAETWDCLSGGRPFASYRWYRYGEAVLDDDTPIYIVLSQQGEPAARSTLWLRRKEQFPIASKIIRRSLEVLLQYWPLLVCQAPLADTPGLILPQDQSLHSKALRTIAQVAKNQAQQYRCSLLVFDYLEEQEAKRNKWPRDFMPITVSDPGTHLPIVWPDFDSYLEHLAKSVRKDYRRHCNRATDLGIKVKSKRITQPLDEAILNQAIVLIRNVEKNHNMPPNPWARAMLENAHMVDAYWLTAEKEDVLVGCGLLLGDENAVEMKLLGLDYQVKYAYFQIIYAALRLAVSRGIHALQGGSGAYEMKQRLGFQLRTNNHVVLTGRGPLFEQYFRWLANKTDVSESEGSQL